MSQRDDDEIEEDEEETEMDPAKKERLNKLRAKAEGVMQELAEEVLEEETIEKAEKSLKTRFSQVGLPYRKDSLKAFCEGLNMMHEGIHAGGGLGHALPVVYSILLKRMEKKIKSQVDKASEGL